MSYKFQLGDSVLSGSLTQEGDIKTNSGGDPTKGAISASLGLRMPAAGTLIVGESVSLNQADLNQIDGITAGTAAASKAVILDGSRDVSNVRNFNAAQLSASGDLQLQGDLKIDGGAVTISHADLIQIDGITAGTVAASKAVVVDGNKDADGFRNLSASALIEAATMQPAIALNTATVSASSGLTMDAAATIVLPGVSLNSADLLQIDGITAGTVAASKAVVVDASKDADGFRNLSASALIEAATMQPALALNTATVSASSGLTMPAAATIALPGVSLNSADLLQIDGITAGTAAASKALVLDGSRDVSNVRNFNAAQLSASGDLQLQGDIVIDGGNVAITPAELTIVNGFADAAYARAEDSVVFFDATTNELRREGNDDFLTAIAGAGLSVAGNQLVAGASTTVTAIGNVDAALAEGTNFGTTTLTGSGGATWRLPNDSALSAGDVFRVKAPGDVGNSYIKITCSVGGHESSGKFKIDGQSEILLEAGGAAVTLVYASGSAGSGQLSFLIF